MEPVAVNWTNADMEAVNVLNDLSEGPASERVVLLWLENNQ